VKEQNCKLRITHFKISRKPPSKIKLQNGENINVHNKRNRFFSKFLTFLNCNTLNFIYEKSWNKQPANWIWKRLLEQLFLGQSMPDDYKLKSSSLLSVTMEWPIMFQLFWVPTLPLFCAIAKFEMFYWIKLSRYTKNYTVSQEPNKTILPIPRCDRQDMDWQRTYVNQFTLSCNIFPVKSGFCM
jgi:hypothetical protein